METLYIGNDHVVEIASLQDQDGNAITSGTVEATLYEASVVNGALVKGSAVSGGSLTLSHEGGGVWSGILDSAAAITHGGTYLLTVTVVVGSTEQQWDIDCRAKWRT